MEHRENRVAQQNRRALAERRRVVRYNLDDPVFLQSLETATTTTRAMARWSKWKCPVSLQHHEGDVWFRDLKIRRLPMNLGSAPEHASMPWVLGPKLP
jgi:hypothetical protein